MALFAGNIIETIQLPEEIYDLILSHASRNTLKVSRLVCRRFNEICQRHLFRTVFLKLNVDSFINLENISKHSQLSSQVHELAYDPTLLPWDLNSFEAYVDYGVTSGLHLDPENTGMDWTHEEVKRAFLDSFSPLQLEYHYQQYCRYLAGQKYLHRNENEVEHLIKIFNRLHRLEKVEILKWWAPEWMRPPIPRRLWNTATSLPSSAGIVAQQTLIQPRGNNQFRLKRVLSVMRAAEAASISIKSLDTGPINIIQLDSNMQTADYYYIEPFLLKLKHLHLHFTTELAIRDTIGYLEVFLSFAQNIELLDLAGEVRVKYAEMGGFPGELRSTVWPRLSILRLSFMSINQGEFLGFLGNHAMSLASLEMNDIHLRGSLVEILVFLAEQMRLGQLRLAGTIGNISSENWMISRKPHGKSTLYDRVVNYVVSSGAFPFVKRTGVNFWLAAEDWSFYSLAPGLLPSPVSTGYLGLG